MKEMNKKEKFLLDYLKSVAEAAVSFCERSGIEEFGPSDIIIYHKKDCYLSAYASISNGEYIFSTSLVREDGEWSHDSAVNIKNIDESESD